MRNARSVHYEGRGVNGTGSSEECPSTKTVYKLVVVDQRNVTTTKTITISVNPGTPTVTPTASATFTPWPTATPTVTPTVTPTRTATPTPTSIPTLTPTPTATVFHVEWSASPPSYTGTGPDVNIVFTNQGQDPDALLLRLDDIQVPDGWQVEVCLGGDCGSSKTTPSVDPGGTTEATVRFSIPVDAPAGASGFVRLRAVSFNDIDYILSVSITVLA